MQRESLVELIYEAAAVPELWVQVLDELAEVGGGEGGQLFTATANRGRYDIARHICSPAISSVAAQWVQPHWRDLNIRDRLVATRELRFVTDLDVFTVEELGCSPFYVNFLPPSGLGWVAQ